MTAGQRIKELRKNLGLTQEQLASMLGLQKSAIAKYENGRVENIKRSTLEKMASIFNCSPSFLLGIGDEDTSANCTLIPIVGRVAAGAPILMVEEIEGYEEIPVRMSRSGNFVAMRIHGQSMEPRMCEGDIIIVKEQEDADDGQIVVACVNGDDATCKKLRRRSGQICLMSNNPAYPPQWYRPGEVDIRGVVVELRAKF